MAVTGEPGRPPVRAGVAVSDLVTGLWAAFGAAAALFARERGAGGRHVEIPMVDATLPLLSYMASTAFVTGQDPIKVGSGHHSVFPYGAFPTRDGWMVIAVLSDKFWPRLCAALGLEDLERDEELATNEGRFRRRQEVEEVLVGVLARLPTDEVDQLLTDAAVPHAPVRADLGCPYDSLCGGARDREPRRFTRGRLQGGPGAVACRGAAVAGPGPR